jgi:hypothetical protein
MYKVLIRPVLTYATETWTLSKINERRLGLIETRVVRRIFGTKQENGKWRKRYNYELYEMFKDSDIVVYIKAKRLAWAGHLTRMSDERTLYLFLFIIYLFIKSSARSITVSNTTCCCNRTILLLVFIYIC